MRVVARSRAIRALLIAEACNPDWVSIPLEGWSHSRAIAALTEAHLVTHVRNRENIARAGLTEGVEFSTLDTSRLDEPFRRLTHLLGTPFGSNRGWTVLTALATFSYYYFEQLLWQRLGARIRSGEFDVVHRLTPLSPVTPSLLARRCARVGVPFVLGPLNGGLPWPRGFEGLRRTESEWLSYVRGASRMLPAYRSTREFAAAIIAGSRQARSEIGPRYLAKTVYVPENGVEPTRFAQVAAGPADLPVRIAFVGRLVPLKCTDVVMEAAAPLLRAGRARLDIIGDGPALPALRTLAAREGIEGHVSFAGWVDHHQINERLAACHVFAFPSVREFGGAVVLEAMAAGLVPIVVDYGGPGEIVSAGTGFVVPLGSRGEIVLRLRRVLEELAADPSMTRAIGQRARGRVLRSFTWEAKAAQVLEIYRWVLRQRDKPDFGMPLADPA